MANESTRVFHPEEVTSLANISIGKRIRCNYMATQNTVGVFRNLGEETAPLLPVLAPAVPYGDFYWICVDIMNEKLFFIPDRNLQGSISYDAMNVAGVASGSGLPLEKILASAIPAMTSDSTPYGKASASSYYNQANNPAWRMFDKTNADWLHATSQIAGTWIRYDFPVSKLIKSYSLTGGGSNMSTDYLKAWRLEGSNDNGVTWQTIDSQANQTFGVLQKRDFPIPLNNTPYTSYRIYILANGGGGYTRMSEFDLLEETNQIPGTIRLMTGGFSAADLNNEWDKYIVNSSLKQKIVAGSNAEWNWNGRWSLTSTTLSTSATSRVVRGYNASNGYSSVATNDQAIGNVNFRPLLIIKTGISKKFLFQQGTDIKAPISNNWVTIGQAPVTESMFKQYGVDNFMSVTESMLDVMSTNSGKIIGWTDDITADKINISVNATPYPRVVYPDNNFNITPKGIKGFKLAGGSDGTGVVRVIVSIDSGVTWKTYSNNAWKTIDGNIASVVKSEGISVSSFNLISQMQWMSLIGNSNTIRFAYYLELGVKGDIALVDTIQVQNESYAIATPIINSFKIAYDSLSISGRLQELERMNAINLAKLNFKSNSLMMTDRYAMKGMIVDTCQSDQMILIASPDGITSTKKVDMTSTQALGAGFISTYAVPKSIIKIDL